MRGECTADTFDGSDGNGNEEGNSNGDGNDNNNGNHETKQSAEVDVNVMMVGT